MIITIDGPTASGKSTIGRLLAKKLGAYYLYSGLLYRAVAYLLITRDGYTLTTIDTPNLKKVRALVDPSVFSYRYDDMNGDRIFFEGEDITPFLKDPMIDQAASILSTDKPVRDIINTLQRQIADSKDVIVDGRDAGSIVFPQADYKFYITADKKERAARWQAAQKEKGNDVSLDDALSYLNARDQRDSERVHDPLSVPRNAQVIDTTNMTINHVVEEIFSYMQNRQERSVEHRS